MSNANQTSRLSAGLKASEMVLKVLGSAAKNYVGKKGLAQSKSPSKLEDKASIQTFRKQEDSTQSSKEDLKAPSKHVLKTQLRANRKLKKSSIPPPKPEKKPR